MRIAFTGHRPQKFGPNFDKNQYDLNGFAARIVFGLREKYSDAVMISGMALGWDMAVANVCVANVIPWVAAVPFEGQEMVWQPRWRTHYRNLLRDCPEVHVICGVGYEPWKMQKRNMWMVDNSELLVALWDGSSGGTHHCVRYAERAKKPIVNVWDSWQASPR